jgi:hypothetical protein
MLLVGAGYEPYSESQPGAQHLTPSPRTWHLVIPRLGSEAAFPPTFGDSLPGMDQPVAQITKEAGAPDGAYTNLFLSNDQADRVIRDLSPRLKQRHVAAVGQVKFRARRRNTSSLDRIKHSF